MFGATRTRLLIAFIAGCLSLAFVSCEQYPYDSPGPGILEVRLRAKITDPVKAALLPFGPIIDSLGIPFPRNIFGFVMTKLEVKDPGGNSLEIYADLYAIRRNPDGDYFNCLDTLARDSGYVLGSTFAPPIAYPELDLRLTPLDEIIVNGQFSTNVIEVRMPDPIPSDLQRLTTFGASPLAIQVEENRLTRVTVTFDLDSSLIRRTEWYEYRPYFYISSVETF